VEEKREVNSRRSVVIGCKNEFRDSELSYSLSLDRSAADQKLGIGTPMIYGEWLLSPERRSLASMQNTLP